MRAWIAPLCVVLLACEASTPPATDEAPVEPTVTTPEEPTADPVAEPDPWAPAAPEPAPALEVSPTSFELPGELGAFQKLKLHNASTKPLTIVGLELKGVHFRVLAGGAEYGPGNAKLDPPLLLKPKEVMSWTVRQVQGATEVMPGLLHIETSDGVSPKTAVEWSSKGPGKACLEVLQGDSLWIPTAAVGDDAAVSLTVRSCGSLPARLTGLSLGRDTHGDFALEIVSHRQADPPSSNHPALLPPGESLEARVRFRPVVPPESGLFAVRTATVAALGDGLRGAPAIAVTAIVAAEDAPVVTIQVAEGHEVIPQTLLHLDVGQSAPAGAVTKWQWSVNQPPTSKSLLMVSPDATKATFEPNVAGVYTFRVDYWFQTGEQGPPALAMVVVYPDSAIHAELTWTTPGDPDETDVGKLEDGTWAGSDLDLHLLHPFAGGPDLDGDDKPDGWFDQPFDCFFFNPSPQWGSFDPFIEDDPSLDRDDTDGAGPENINLDIPEPLKTYRLGVHYWNDHRWGLSYARVRLFLYGTLVYDTGDLELVHHDMWEVLTIDWPSGKVRKIVNQYGGDKITPKYTNPFFSPGG